MIIGKTVIVKSAPNLDEKVNAKIQELKSEYNNNSMQWANLFLAR